MPTVKEREKVERATLTAEPIEPATTVQGEVKGVPKHQEKVRVQFEFALDALAKLDALKLITKAATRAETIRNALRLYEWFVNEAQSDSTIKCVDKKGKTISQFPASLLL